MDFEFIDINDLENSSPEVEQGSYDLPYMQESKKKKIDDITAKSTSLSETSNLDDISYIQESKKMKIDDITAKSTSLPETANLDEMIAVNTIPILSMTDLIFLILKNENCILTSQIWNYLSGLFPYYERAYAPLVGNTKVVSVIGNNTRLFHKNDSLDGSMIKLVLLGPAVEWYHNIVLERARTKRMNLTMALYLPGVLDQFLRGVLDFSTVKLFRTRIRPFSFGDSVNSIIDAIEGIPEHIESNEEKTYSLDSCEQKIHFNETTQFSPKIVEICTIEDDETLSTVSVSSLASVEESNILDSLNNPSRIVEPIDFVNCVWSNDTAEDVDVESVPESIYEYSFPEVEKCIPKWKEIFPWVTWHPQQRSIGCSECQFVHRKCGSQEILAVVMVKNASEIFKVSKRLRQHSEKMSHKLTKILVSKQLIAILHFLLSLHYNDFTDMSDILNSCRALCDNGNSITQESLCFAFRILGEYLEHRTILSIKQTEMISVMADACSGIIIVRFFKSEKSVEEHVIASYMSVTDKNPLEYLASLGIDVEEKVIHYLANSRCEECIRCSKTKKQSIKSLVPMRLPTMEKFLLFIWGSSLMKPIHSLCSTIRRLWKSHPHRFGNVRNLSLANFGKFNYNPSIVVNMFDSIDEIKKSARIIYDVNGHVEALGLCYSETKHVELLLPLFPILSQIITLMVQIKCSYPIDNDQEKLYKCIDSMRMLSLQWKKNVGRDDYSKLSMEMDDLISLICLTVKEFFEPIYYKGRSLPLSLNRVFDVENLRKHESAIASNKSFEAVFSVIQRFYKYEKGKLYHGLITFFKTHTGLQKMEISKMLETFNVASSLRREHEEVYEFLRLFNLMPFHSANVNRCMYEIKVYENRFYKSAWAGIGSKVKENTLTILSELDNNRRLSEIDMLNWWKSKYLQK